MKKQYFLVIIFIILMINSSMAQLLENIQNAGQNAAQTVQQETQNIQNTTQQVAEDTAETVEQVVNDVTNTGQQAGQDAQNTGNQTGENVHNTTEQIVLDVKQGMNQVTKDAKSGNMQSGSTHFNESTEQVAKDFGTGVQKTDSDFKQGVNQGAENLGKGIIEGDENLDQNNQKTTTDLQKGIQQGNTITEKGTKSGAENTVKIIESGKQETEKQMTPNGQSNNPNIMTLDPVLEDCQKVFFTFKENTTDGLQTFISSHIIPADWPVIDVNSMQNEVSCNSSNLICIVSPSAPEQSGLTSNHYATITQSGNLIPYKNCVNNFIPVATTAYSYYFPFVLSVDEKMTDGTNFQVYFKIDGNNYTLNFKTNCSNSNSSNTYSGNQPSKESNNKDLTFGGSPKLMEPNSSSVMRFTVKNTNGFPIENAQIIIGNESNNSLYGNFYTNKEGIVQSDKVVINEKYVAMIVAQGYKTENRSGVFLLDSNSIEIILTPVNMNQMPKKLTPKN